MGACVVVGATGILVPLADLLVDTAVIGVARHPGHGASVGADTTTVAGVEVVVEAVARWRRDGGRGPVSAAVYAPAVLPERLGHLLQVIDGRAVLVVTSAAATPTGGREVAVTPHQAAAGWPLRPGDGVVLLGWSGPAGAPRWHTPGEVSDAAARALCGGQDVLLGRVRPWQERPT